MADELDIYKLGQIGTNGGDNKFKWEGMLAARMRINPENPYDGNQTKTVHNMIQNMELDAQQGEDQDQD